MDSIVKPLYHTGYLSAFEQFLANEGQCWEVFLWNTRLWWCQGNGFSLVLSPDGTPTVVADTMEMQLNCISLLIPVLNEDEYDSGDIQAAVDELRKSFNSYIFV